MTSRQARPQAPETDELAGAVYQALRREPRLGADLDLKRVAPAGDGAVIVEAEVDKVGQKKIALECAAAVKGVSGIVDRIRVRPASPMSDEEIRAHIRDALLNDPSFMAVAISERLADRIEIVRPRIDAPLGHILIEVADGVVTLTGETPGLASKRLAGVIAWWVPGSRDVIIGLAVEPSEEDGPDRIAEAVRIALEKDPFVNAERIRVGVRRRTVRLDGIVPSEEERHMAETDAWCVFGVDDVVNEIEVAP